MNTKEEYFKKVASENYEFLKREKIYEKSISSGFLIKFEELNKTELPDAFRKFEFVLESKIIPFISYPYEWSFNQLKEAALHHLNFSNLSFKSGCSFKDSSAYNIQFNQGRPLFIDILSLKKYEWKYWNGYAQFCENF